MSKVGIFARIVLVILLSSVALLGYYFHIEDQKKLNIRAQQSLQLVGEQNETTATRPGNH